MNSIRQEWFFGFFLKTDQADDWLSPKLTAAPVTVTLIGCFICILDDRWQFDETELIVTKWFWLDVSFDSELQYKWDKICEMRIETDEDILKKRNLDITIVEYCRNK